MGANHMAETNYFKMMADFWESAGKTATDAQKNFLEEIKGRFGTGFPMPFPSVDAGSAQASEKFLQLLNSLMVLPGAVEKATGLPATSDKQTSELLKKIMNPQEWLTVTGYSDRTVQQLVEGPQFADIGQMEAKFATLFKAWSELRSRSLEQSTQQLSAWAKAAQEFTEKLLAETKGGPPESKQKMVALWVDIANRHLFELQRSSAYLKNQRELLKASTAFRRAQTELSDQFGEAFGIPTRSEIDDLTKTVASLKREIRADQRKRRQKNPDAGDRGKPHDAS